MVASELNLQKDYLLIFHPLSIFGIDLSCYVNGVCGESYFSINRSWRLGIIEDAFVEECYGDMPPFGTYEICYKGSIWSVSTSKLHTSYVFSQGWPKVCNNLGIKADDLLIFRKLDDDVFQLSKAEYYDNVFKEDDKVCISEEDPSEEGKVHSGKPKKVDVQKSLRKRDASQLKTMQDRLPVEVVKRAGLSEKLQPLSVQNMTGDVEVYETKTDLNEGKLRYAIDGWRKFMTDNDLQFGHMLHFTYVTSQKKIVLNDVTSM
ncbi:putative transcription factor B3-Domain family [Helianthus anomalus]